MMKNLWVILVHILTLLSINLARYTVSMFSSVLFINFYKKQLLRRDSNPWLHENEKRRFCPTPDFWASVSSASTRRCRPGPSSGPACSAPWRSAAPGSRPGWGRWEDRDRRIRESKVWTLCWALRRSTDDRMAPISCSRPRKMVAHYRRCLIGDGLEGAALKEVP